MTRRASFRQADLTRAIKAADAAGKRVEVVNGVIRFVALTESAATPSPTDPLDAELAQWAERHGYG